MNLVQHVSDATHIAGHTLDYVITRNSDNAVLSDTVNVSSLLTDHHAVEFSMRLSKPDSVKQVIQYRSLRKINHNELRCDMRQLSVVTHPDDSLPALVNQFNSDLSKFLDKHAPLTSRSLPIRPFSPWYDDQIIAAKQERRRRESQWRISKLTVHRQLYIEQRQLVMKLLRTKRMEFHGNQAKENPSNARVIFSTANKLLQRNIEKPLPKYKSTSELAEEFSAFFANKISTIRQCLSISRQDTVDSQQPTELSHGAPSLSNFGVVDEEEVRKIISTSLPKSCSLDPLPTSLLKENIDIILPSITKIVYKSITSGCFPSIYKTAQVTPLLKKSSLDPDTRKNYRPVSNLPFVSKIVEKVVASRLNTHMAQNSILEPSQSAYRKHHSTETALLRVQNDILQAIDRKKCVMLLLLDLSAAFDTIDHEILLQRLRVSGGVCGTALAWFRSYLSGRTQSVKILNTTSKPRLLRYGVPQGSVLGPLLFTLYSAPIASIVRRHGLIAHLYADDTQLYIVFDQDDAVDTIKRIEACVMEIKEWMAMNWLKLNDEKTLSLLLRTPTVGHLSNISDIIIGDNNITPSPSARNLVPFSMNI